MMSNGDGFGRKPVQIDMVRTGPPAGKMNKDSALYEATLESIERNSLSVTVERRRRGRASPFAVPVCPVTL